MNIPMSVQADALQVMMPAAATDYIPVWVNAFAILIGTLVGVFVGFALSKRDRELQEKSKHLKNVVLGYRYVQGMLGAQQNSLRMLLLAANPSGNRLLENKLPEPLHPLKILDFDYSQLAIVLDYMPSIAVDCSSVFEATASLNNAISCYKEVHARSGCVNWKQRRFLYAKIIKQAWSCDEAITKIQGQISASSRKKLRNEILQHISPKIRSDYSILVFSDSDVRELHDKSKLLYGKLKEPVDM